MRPIPALTESSYEYLVFRLGHQSVSPAEIVEKILRRTIPNLESRPCFVDGRVIELLLGTLSDVWKDERNRGMGDPAWTNLQLLHDRIGEICPDGASATASIATKSSTRGAGTSLYNRHPGRRLAHGDLVLCSLFSGEIDVAEIAMDGEGNFFLRVVPCTTGCLLKKIPEDARPLLPLCQIDLVRSVTSVTTNTIT